MRCRYNTANFHQNIHERHTIARPSGRGMGCLLWVQPLINILPQFLQWCVQYHLYRAAYLYTFGVFCTQKWQYEICTTYKSICTHKQRLMFHWNFNFYLKGCVSLDPSKISKSGWWGLQLDAWQLCNSLWYGLINSKLHINKKTFFLYHTTSDGVTVQCFKSPSWPLRDGLDPWPQLIYTLSWESQHEEI